MPVEHSEKISIPRPVVRVRRTKTKTESRRAVDLKVPSVEHAPKPGKPSLLAETLGFAHVLHQLFREQTWDSWLSRCVLGVVYLTFFPIIWFAIFWEIVCSSCERTPKLFLSRPCAEFIIFLFFILATKLVFTLSCLLGIVITFHHLSTDERIQTILAQLDEKCRVALERRFPDVRTGDSLELGGAFLEWLQSLAPVPVQGEGEEAQVDAEDQRGVEDGRSAGGDNHTHPNEERTPLLPGTLDANADPNVDEDEDLDVEAQAGRNRTPPPTLYTPLTSPPAIDNPVPLQRRTSTRGEDEEGLSMSVPPVLPSLIPTRSTPPNSLSSSSSSPSSSPIPGRPKPTSSSPPLVCPQPRRVEDARLFDEEGWLLVANSTVAG